VVALVPATDQLGKTVYFLETESGCRSGEAARSAVNRDLSGVLQNGAPIVVILKPTKDSRQLRRLNRWTR
jgi:hypothetical protein